MTSDWSLQLGDVLRNDSSLALWTPEEAFPIKHKIVSAFTRYFTKCDHTLSLAPQKSPTRYRSVYCRGEETRLQEEQWVPWGHMADRWHVGTWPSLCLILDAELSINLWKGDFKHQIKTAWVFTVCLHLLQPRHWHHYAGTSDSE